MLIELLLKQFLRTLARIKLPCTFDIQMVLLSSFGKITALQMQPLNASKYSSSKLKPYQTFNTSHLNLGWFLKKRHSPTFGLSSFKIS